MELLHFVVAPDQLGRRILDDAIDVEMAFRSPLRAKVDHIAIDEGGRKRAIFDPNRDDLP